MGALKLDDVYGYATGMIAGTTDPSRVTFIEKGDIMTLFFEVRVGVPLRYETAFHFHKVRVKGNLAETLLPILKNGEHFVAVVGALEINADGTTGLKAHNVQIGPS